MMRPLDRRNTRRQALENDSKSLVSEQQIELQVDDSRTVQTVCGTKLLIGSDAGCDVWLPGFNMPELHSIFHRDCDGAWLDVLINSPEAKVNGRPTQFTQLQDGDVCTIGTVRMIVRLVDRAVPLRQMAMRLDARLKDAVDRQHDRDSFAAAGSTALLQAVLERAVPGEEIPEEAEPAIMPLSAVYRMNPDRRKTARDAEMVGELEKQSARLELIRRDLRDLCDNSESPSWNFLLAVDQMIDRLEELISTADSIEQPSADSRSEREPRRRFAA